MKIRVWGLAKGRGSTEDAARGAFTWREYETESFPREDWVEVLRIEIEKEAQECQKQF